MGGFGSQSAFSSTGWTGGTYVSTGEQLGAWTDIKATHAWGNLFYNSSRKAAYASLRCSSLGAIRELSALEMLINMNLCPDGFYLVYGHAEPPCFLPLPWGWDMNLGAAVARISVQKVVCEEAGILSCGQSSWCGRGCVAAAGVLPHSCSSGDVMVCAVLRLRMPFREWQRGREETQWETRKRKDQAWAVFVNKQNLTLSSEFWF